MRSILLLLVLSCAVIAISGQSSRDFLDKDKSNESGGKKSDKFSRTSVDRNEIVKDGNPRTKYAKSKNDEKSSETSSNRDDKKDANSIEKSDKSNESFESTTKRKHSSKVRTTTESNGIPIDYDDRDSKAADNQRKSDKKSKSTKSKTDDDSNGDNNGSAVHLTKWIFGELNSFFKVNLKK